MNDRLKSYKSRIAMVDIIMLILGVGMLIWGNELTNMLLRVVAVIVGICGLVLLINFLINKDKEPFDWMIMVTGIIVLAGAVLLFIFAESITAIAVYLLGTLLVIYGLIDIITAITITRHVGGYWWISLIVGLGALILGAVAIYLNYIGYNTVTALIGITFIIAAIGGIVNAVQAYIGKKRILKALKNAPPPPPPPPGASPEDASNNRSDMEF